MRQPHLALLMEKLPADLHDVAAPPTIVEVIEDRYKVGERGSLLGIGVFA
jgi:hypothetical protein